MDETGGYKAEPVGPQELGGMCERLRDELVRMSQQLKEAHDKLRKLEYARRKWNEHNAVQMALLGNRIRSLNNTIEGFQDIAEQNREYAESWRKSALNQKEYQEGSERIGTISILADGSFAICPPMHVVLSSNSDSPEVKVLVRDNNAIDMGCFFSRGFIAEYIKGLIKSNTPLAQKFAGQVIILTQPGCGMVEFGSGGLINLVAVILELLDSHIRPDYFISGTSGIDLDGNTESVLGLRTKINGIIQRAKDNPNVQHVFFTARDDDPAKFSPWVLPYYIDLDELPPNLQIIPVDNVDGALQYLRANGFVEDTSTAV